MSARAMLVVVLLLTLTAVPGGADHGGPGSIVTEVITIPSATVGERDFLAGAAGTPVAIGGELKVPVTPVRIPAVVLLHGAGGVSANVRRWAGQITAMGIATLVVDSFNGRGIAEIATDGSRLAPVTMIVDAYRALGVLADDPRLDARRVAVMGFSTGGFAALYASVTRFQRLHAPGGREFAAYLAFYPSCTTRYLEDDRVSAHPIRVLHGTADDWAPVDACRRHVARLRAAGADARLLEMAGARHLFDLHDLPPLLRLPGVERGRCALEERAGGTLVDRATGKAASRAACVERGATVGYDARARDEAARVVTDTLTRAFGGGS